jgi:hypothetical protein
MRYLATVIVALALLSPASALAQDSPFDGQLPPAQPTPAPTVEPIQDSSEDDVGRNTLWIIGGGLLVFFVGIGVWISRDARSNLPAEERDHLGRPRDQGPHKHAQQAKAKARAKTRAQKQARKAHRKKARR